MDFVSSVFFLPYLKEKKLSTKNVLVLNYCFNKNKVTCRDQVIDTFIICMECFKSSTENKKSLYLIVFRSILYKIDKIKKEIRYMVNDLDPFRAICNFFRRHFFGLKHGKLTICFDVSAILQSLNARLGTQN